MYIHILFISHSPISEQLSHLITVNFILVEFFYIVQYIVILLESEIKSWVIEHIFIAINGISASHICLLCTNP